MRRHQHILSLLLLSASALWSCTKTTKNTTIVTPDPDVKDSFVDGSNGKLGPNGLGQVTLTEGQDLAASQGHWLGIKTSAFDKEFLLQASTMMQEPLPQFYGIRSRVIAFKEVGDAVFMLEVTQGHEVTDELPTKLVLAKFPIVARADEAVFIDFASGMSALFATGDWSSAESAFEYDPGTYTEPMKNSFIESLEVKGPALVIHQIAQLAGPESSDSVAVKYYLEPYLPNPKFTPTPGKGLNIFGYFETAPTFDGKTGSLSSNSGKWDISKPIVYAVSANTPEPYVKAVEDAVLYWNHAFDKPVFQVIRAPQGVTAPDYAYNLIQWVNWPDAGFAYADDQLDPRTGEVRHAQVFMTSVFAISGEATARQLLAEAEAEKEQARQPHKKSRGFALRGFDTQILCHRGLEKRFLDALRQLVDSGAGDQEYLRISQDMVRETVAHEVGHTLGLRHNFAGSLGASYNLDERKDILKKYVAEAQVDETVQPTSSVMDYHRLTETLLAGHIVGEGKRMLDYDRKAIRYLYLDQFEGPVPILCTDSQKNYIDCQPFDIGSNPIDMVANDIKQLSPVQKYLTDVYLNYGQPTATPVLDSEAGDWHYYADVRSPLALVLGEDAPLLKVRRAVLQSGDAAREQIKNDEAAALRDSLDRAGGWEKLLATPSDEEFKALPEAVTAELAKAVGADGNPAFTAEQLEAIKKDLQVFVPRLQASFQKQKLELMNSVTTLNNPALAASLVDWLAPDLANTVSAVSDRKIAAKKFDKDGKASDFMPNDFLYPADVRQQAWTLLSSLNYKASNEDWRAIPVRTELRKKLNEKWQADVGGDSFAVDLRSYDDVGAAWVKSFTKILHSIY